MATFDKSSGVVYTETTSAPAGSMINTWAYQARGKRRTNVKVKNGRYAQGAARLEEMALRSCVQNLELMNAETLKGVDWVFAERIYRYCLDREALSFHDWSIFFESHPSEISEIKAHHTFTVKRDSFDKYPLDHGAITQRLAKVNPNVVTFLCLRSFNVTMDLLIGLTKIPTLSVLTLEQPREASKDPTLNLKRWGRAVKESGAFQNLEILVLDNLNVKATEILDAASYFPILDLVGSHDREIYHSTPRPDRYGYGEWTMWIQDPDALYLPSMFPTRFWQNSHRDIHEKMKTMYDWNRKRNQMYKDQYRSISLVDLHSSYKHGHYTCEWYTRPRPEKKVEHTKREVVIGESITAPGANKRRKIRDGKQVDLGSMLGGFT